MTIETGLHAFLSADATISAAVSTRVYPVRLPEIVTLPAVTYQRIAAPRTRSQSGPSNLARATFQIDAWAETYDVARTLGDALRSALDGYKGTMGDTAVQSSMLETDLDLYDPDARAYRVMTQFAFWHRE